MGKNYQTNVANKRYAAKGEEESKKKNCSTTLYKNIQKNTKNITATTLVCNNGIKWQPDTWQKMQRADEAKIQLKKNTYLLQKQQQ